MKPPATGSSQRHGQTGRYIVPASYTSPARVWRSAATNVW